MNGLTSRVKVDVRLASPTSNSTDDVYYDSWIRGPVALNTQKDWIPSERCRSFDENGYIKVDLFTDISESRSMKTQIKRLVDENWDVGSKEKKVTEFRTDEKQVDAQGNDSYFLESSAKIHFFSEKDVLDDKGNLRDEFACDKLGALNKVGHGLHLIPGAFRDYTTSDKIRNLVKELGWVDPKVPQSMYIFKQPLIGGEVTSHQDSSFLYTNPTQSCLGLWLALDDATKENGCLWVRPGSHREKVRRRFVRNAEHFGNAINTRSNTAMGDRSKPQLIFNDESDKKAKRIPWDGKLPCGSRNDPTVLVEMGFVPVECNAGDLVVFGGQLDHLSLPNYSLSPRHTFQLHLVDSKTVEGSEIIWSKSNWLQYPLGIPFLGINQI